MVPIDPASEDRGTDVSSPRIRGDFKSTSVGTRESRKRDDDHLELIRTGLYDAKAYAGYFAELATRYARFVSRARSISGLLCLASASTLVSQHYLAAVWAPLLAALAGAVTMWDTLWSISEKAREASVLQGAWGHLAIRYRSLWSSVHDSNAESVLRDLEEEGAQLERPRASLDRSARWYRDFAKSIQQTSCGNGQKSPQPSSRSAITFRKLSTIGKCRLARRIGGALSLPLDLQPRRRYSMRLKIPLPPTPRPKPPRPRKP